MWIARRFSDHKASELEGTAADMGVTTIGGKNAAVLTRGEQRELEVFSPGGVVWQPRAGDTVLVVRGGMGGQERCVVAAANAGQAPADMVPGELYLYSGGGASLFLRADGSILATGPVELRGDLQVSGAVRVAGRVDIQGALTVNGEAYRPCDC